MFAMMQGFQITGEFCLKAILEQTPNNVSNNFLLAVNGFYFLQ